MSQDGVVTLPPHGYKGFLLFFTVYTCALCICVFITSHTWGGQCHFSCHTVAKSLHLQANTEDVSCRKEDFFSFVSPFRCHLPLPIHVNHMHARVAACPPRRSCSLLIHPSILIPPTTKRLNQTYGSSKRELDELKASSADTV